MNTLEEWSYHIWECGCGIRPASLDAWDIKMIRNSYCSLGKKLFDQYFYGPIWEL